MKTILCVVALWAVLALSVESIPPPTDPNQPIPHPPNHPIPGAPPVDSEPEQSVHILGHPRPGHGGNHHGGSNHGGSHHGVPPQPQTPEEPTVQTFFRSNIALAHPRPAHGGNHHGGSNHGGSNHGGSHNGVPQQPEPTVQTL